MQFIQDEINQSLKKKSHGSIYSKIKVTHISGHSNLEIYKEDLR